MKRVIFILILLIIILAGCNDIQCPYEDPNFCRGSTWPTTIPVTVTLIPLPPPPPPPPPPPEEDDDDGGLLDFLTPEPTIFYSPLPTPTPTVRP